MILVTSVDCGGMDILRLIKIVMIFLKIVFFVVPIILMVMMSIDFFKNLLSGKDEEIRKNISIVLKRIVACILLFLVPTFFNIITNMLGTDYSKCFELAKNVELLKNEVSVDSSNNNSNNKPNNNSSDNYFNNDSGKSEGNEDTITTTKTTSKNKTTTIKITSKNTTTTSKITSKNTTTTSKITSNKITTTTTKTSTTKKQSTSRKNIFIGDSRCVGIQNSIAASEKNKSKWICKVAQGYSWLKSTAINTLNTMIEPNEYYNIYINLGVNDMHNISSYISYFNAMQKNSKYKNCNFIIVSVNPVDAKKAQSYGYNSVSNDAIISFNSKMKNGLDNGISYCDTYSKVIHNFQTTDGLHYNNSTSKNIYNHIINCK